MIGYRDPAEVISDEFPVWLTTGRRLQAYHTRTQTGRSSGIDYLLKIVTRDIEAYQEIVDQFLTSGLGIDRYFTYVVTRAVKSDIQPPVPLVARILARAEQ